MKKKKYSSYDLAIVQMKLQQLKEDRWKYIALDCEDFCERWIKSCEKKIAKIRKAGYSDDEPYGA